MTAERTRRPTSGGGFTLIELIAVMLLLGILAGVAAPALGSIEATRRAAAARQIVRDLTFARQHGQATGRTTWVIFEPAAERYRLLVEDPAAPGRAGAVPLLASGAGTPMLRQLDADSFVGVEILSVGIGGGVEVGFDWRGRPESAAEVPLSASGTITIGSGIGVTIQPGTGLAETFGL